MARIFALFSILLLSLMVLAEPLSSPFQDPIPFRFAETFEMMRPTNNPTILTVGLRLGSGGEKKRKIEFSPSVDPSHSKNTCILSTPAIDGVPKLKVTGGHPESANLWELRFLNVQKTQTWKKPTFAGEITRTALTETFQIQNQNGKTMTLVCNVGCWEIPEKNQSRHCGDHLHPVTALILKKLGVKMAKLKDIETPQTPQNPKESHSLTPHQSEVTR